MITQDYLTNIFLILEKSYVKCVLVLFKTNSTEVKDDTANLRKCASLSSLWVLTICFVLVLAVAVIILKMQPFYWNSFAYLITLCTGLHMGF